MGPGYLVEEIFQLALKTSHAQVHIRRNRRRNKGEEQDHHPGHRLADPRGPQARRRRRIAHRAHSEGSESEGARTTSVNAGDVSVCACKPPSMAVATEHDGVVGCALVNKTRAAARGAHHTSSSFRLMVVRATVLRWSPRCGRYTGTGKNLG